MRAHLAAGGGRWPSGGKQYPAGRSTSLRHRSATLPTPACARSRLALVDAATRSAPRHTTPAPPRPARCPSRCTSTTSTRGRTHRWARVVGTGRAHASDAGTPAISTPARPLVAAVREAAPWLPSPGRARALARVERVPATPCDGAALRRCFPLAKAAGDGGRARGAARASLSRHRSCSRRRTDRGALAPRWAPPERRLVTLCRRLTKQFETVVTLPAQALSGLGCQRRHRRRGEFVLVRSRRAALGGGRRPRPDAAGPCSPRCR